MTAYPFLRDVSVLKRGVIAPLFCAYFLITNSSFAPAEPTVRHVGFIGALSGFGRDYGVACKNGLEMGIAGSSLRVTFEDDQFDPKKTVAAFRKLVHVDRVSAILVLGSTPARRLLRSPIRRRFRSSPGPATRM